MESSLDRNILGCVYPVLLTIGAAGKKTVS